MRQFLAVTDHSSLKLAANSMHRTPAAISMTLKLIETELGGALFEGERKQSLTPLGKYVHERATRAVDEYQTAVDDINRYSRGESGAVRIAAVPSMTTHLLPKAISELCGRFPDLQIDLRDIDSPAVAKALIEGVVDIGIASLSTRSKELEIELLAEDPFMCVCPKHHPLTELSKDISWEQIESYPFIANGLCNQIDVPEVRKLTAGAQIHLRNVVSLTAFVRAGFGVTLLPRRAVSQVSDLSTLSLQDHRATRKLYLMRQSGRSLPPAARVLFEAIQRLTQHAFE